MRRSCRPRSPPRPIDAVDGRASCVYLGRTLRRPRAGPARRRSSLERRRTRPRIEPDERAGRTCAQLAPRLERPRRRRSSPRRSAIANWHASHTASARAAARRPWSQQAGWVRRCPDDGIEHLPAHRPRRHRADHGCRRPAAARIERHAGRPTATRCSPASSNRGSRSSTPSSARCSRSPAFDVVDPRYLGSQPWPFPASLMLGFTRAGRTPGPPEHCVPTAPRSSTCAGSAARSSRGAAAQILLPGPHLDRPRASSRTGTADRSPTATVAGERAETLLAGLDDQQRVAAEALLGPVCMLAGAGTGKTRAITHRIAYGVATGAYAPNRVMALTFTSRVGGRAARPAPRSSAPAACRRAPSTRPRCRSSTSSGRRWSAATLPRIARQQGAPARPRGRAPAASSSTPPRCATSPAEIEWRKVSRLTHRAVRGTVAARDRCPASLTVEQAIDLQQAYEDLKDERRQIDFEDVLLACAGMIEIEPRVAMQVREQYRFFVVDEYQDVSPLQHAAAASSGSATAATCASSATPARPSTRSPGAAATTCSTSRARHPRRHRRAARAELPLDARRSSTRPTG